MSLHFTRIVATIALSMAAVDSPALARPLTQASAPAPNSGVVEVISRHDVDTTVALLKADIAKKGIRFFDAIDQSALAKSADIALSRSVLLVFGNPPLGIQFLTSTPYAGLDWPVRMLVFEGTDGKVHIAWTDFAYIGRRHAMTDRDAQLKMANEVAASIASAATAQ
ncbi:MAG: DUF302 domain-containing protein [Sphingomonas sp.]